MTKRLQLTLAAVVVVAIIVALVVNVMGGDDVEQVHETPSPVAATAVAASSTAISTVAPATPPPVTSTLSPSQVPAPSPSPPPPSPTPVTVPDPTPTAAPVETPTPAPTSVPTPAPTPTPGLPNSLAVSIAVLISDLGINSDEVEVVSAERVEWPSTALGCPKPGFGYAAVIVSGWKFTLAHGEEIYEFHADESDDNVINCTAPVIEVESPDMVNVVAAAGLDATTAIGISRFDFSSGEYKWIKDVTDPAEISKFIAILDMQVPIVPAMDCQPIFEITFEMPGRSETFEYICAGTNTLLRGEQSFWGGGDGEIPLEFGPVFGPHVSAGPIPTLGPGP